MGTAVVVGVGPGRGVEEGTPVAVAVGEGSGGRVAAGTEGEGDGEGAPFVAAQAAVKPASSRSRVGIRIMRSFRCRDMSASFVLQNDWAGTGLSGGNIL